jgi:hypothetical protein
MKEPWCEEVRQVAEKALKDSGITIY